MTTLNGSAQESPSVLHMAAPLIVSFWMRAAVTMIDTVYAALLGDPAVAAIGLTVPFEFLMIALWVGLSTGLTSALSRAMGAKQARKIDQYVSISWRMIWIASPIFTLLGAAIWFVAPHMGLEAAVSRDFQIYGTVLIGGSAFTTFWSILPDSLVKAHYDTRATMWAGIWTNTINVVLNTLFLFVLHWGVFGIALSTVVARLGGLWYAVIRAQRHEARRHAETTGWSDEPDAEPYRRILGLAVPASMTFLLMALETALVNWLLARGKHATEAIASYSIFYRVAMFAMQPVIATAVAMLPYAARHFGEDDVVGVRRGLRDSVVASSIYAIAVVGPVMLLSAPWIAARLSESPLTREYATFALRLVPLVCLSGALFMLCRPVFEAQGQGRPGLIMATLRYVLLTGPLAWLGLQAAESLGAPPLYGLLIGLLIAGAVSSLVFYAWLHAALPRAEQP